MKRIFISIVIMLSMLTITVKAQSVSYAKSLIEQGKYYEAARQLREPADGGDAEAQYLAATLFFEGKGIPKNDAQGVKYATLSANQGNTNAMLLLADHYKNNGQVQKYYQTLTYYIDRHPYLKNEFIGLRLAECYMRGWGVAQNEEKAWEMASENKLFNKMKSTYPNQWTSYKNRHPELYGTVEFKNISVESYQPYNKILSVRFVGERTYVTIRYTNNTKIRRWIASTPNTYLISGGKRYQMQSSSLPTSSYTQFVEAGKSHEYTFTFGYIPRNIQSFDIVEEVSGGSAWRGIRLR